MFWWLDIGPNQLRFFAEIGPTTDLSNEMCTAKDPNLVRPIAGTALTYIEAREDLPRGPSA